MLSNVTFDSLTLVRKWQFHVQVVYIFIVLNYCKTFIMSKQLNQKNDVFWKAASAISNRILVHLLFNDIVEFCCVPVKNWVCDCQSFVADGYAKCRHFNFLLFLSTLFDSEKCVVCRSGYYSYHLSKKLFGLTFMRDQTFDGKHFWSMTHTIWSKSQTFRQTTKPDPLECNLDFSAINDHSECM